MRSACRVIQERKKQERDSMSGEKDNKLWRYVWGCNSPPRMNHFIWKACHHSLATQGNMGRRIKGIGMECPMCGVWEEMNEHVLFTLPFAREIWLSSGLGKELWKHNFRSVQEWILSCGDKVGMDQLEKLVAIAWGIWNARNNMVNENEGVGVPHDCCKL